MAGPPSTAVNATAPEGGWDAEVHLLDALPDPDVSGWGEPAGTVAGAAEGTVAIDVGGGDATYVLLWFTRVPDGGRMAVTQLEVEG